MERADEIRQTVREYYAERASGGSCCAGTNCCGVAEASEDLFGSSLGCGTPLASAEVQPGETVVDLGSGAGGDVLRAAQQVAPHGRAIGVDMTPEMVWKARENARGILPRGNRAPAACRWISRCCHQQLRRQPRPRQGRRLRRGFPGLATGRPPHRRRYGVPGAPARGGSRRSGRVGWVHRRRGGGHGVFGDDPPGGIRARGNSGLYAIFPGSGFQRDCARGEAGGLMGCGLRLCARRDPISCVIRARSSSLIARNS